MKGITYPLFATVWYLAHGQEEEASTLLRGGGIGENNVELEIIEGEETNNVVTNYGDDGIILHERQLQDWGAGSLGDWAFCSSSSQCRSACCSRLHTNNGRIVQKCIPVGSFQASHCVSTGPAPTPTPPPQTPPVSGGLLSFLGRLLASLFK